MSLISVIVPIYNAENYITRCLDSLLNQSFNNLEIILVNDGSTDSSLEICNRYKSKDPRIIIINQVNQGVSVARNRGLEVANGEYIAFVDADDWVTYNMYEKMYNNILEFKADTCLCNYTLLGRRKEIKSKLYFNEKILDKKGILEYIVLDMISSEEMTNIDKANLRSPCIYLYKKKIIIDNMLRFNEKIKIGEDMLFNIEYLLKSEKLSILSDNFYFYNLHDGSATQSYNGYLAQNNSILLEEIKNKLGIIVNQEIVDLKIKYLMVNCSKQEIENICKCSFRYMSINEKINNVKHILEKYNISNQLIDNKLILKYYSNKQINYIKNNNYTKLTYSFIVKYYQRMALILLFRLFKAVQ